MFPLQQYQTTSSVITVVRRLKVLRLKGQVWQAWISSPVPTAASLPCQPTSLSGCPALSTADAVVTQHIHTHI